MQVQVDLNFEYFVGFAAAEIGPKLGASFQGERPSALLDSGTGCQTTLTNRFKSKYHFRLIPYIQIVKEERVVFRFTEKREPFGAVQNYLVPFILHGAKKTRVPLNFQIIILKS